MTQTQRILKYMTECGSITPVEAMREFSCMRLSARIYDLQKAGHRITRKIEHGRNRYGEQTSYARYMLEDAE